MKVWQQLYERHTNMRETDGRTFGNEVRKRLTRLASDNYCNRSVSPQFRHKNLGVLQDWSFTKGPIDLLNLDNLSDVTLTILASIERRSYHFQRFTAVLEGKNGSVSPWIAAVHLDNNGAGQGTDKGGSGACGHPVFHCHVGPDLDTHPKLRVPLPAIGPIGTLDWLLTQVIPEWEPAPWSEFSSS